MGNFSGASIISGTLVLDVHGSWGLQSVDENFWAGGQPQAPSGPAPLVIQMAQCHHCMGLLSYIREGLLDQELPHWRLQHFCYHFSCPLMPYEGQMQSDDEATSRQVLFTIVPALRVLCETTHMLMVLDAPWDIARLLRAFHLSTNTCVPR